MAPGIAIVLLAAFGVIVGVVATIRAPHSWVSAEQESRRRRAGVLLMFWAFGAFILSILALVAFDVIDTIR